MSADSMYPVRIWGIKWAARQGSLILYSPYSFRMINLNRSAAAIWLLSSGRLNVDEVLDKVIAVFGETARAGPDRGSIRDELRQGIRDLESEGLIALLPQPPHDDPERLHLLPHNFGTVPRHDWMGLHNEETARQS
ncbi:MAG TPA: PqqD family protein [Blastocatellia bacterium]|nr:PqqD family protein [Blastocatellia bacterium]